jgi:protein-L-isoaspartate(D-aspartate) O-methyltransferase
MSDLDSRRRYYAEELQAVANLQSEALVDAFAKVSRENFLGPGPWLILNPFHSIDESNEASYYRETVDADPKHLYHNVLVAIDAKHCLNNGQPSFLATLIDSLELIRGDSVAHIGCGTGYYTAIIAEVVGSAGRVTAFEVDTGLAAEARTNLSHLSHVQVLGGDGGSVASNGYDGMLVNAGATHPRQAWLDALRIRGRLILPLTVLHEADITQSGQIVKFQRQENGWSARFLCSTSIYPCSGARDPDLNDKLRAAFRRGDWNRVRSLRRDAHSCAETCWLHDEQFCLSTLPLG